MIPNYLYHYTSLEVLILILKEGKIRFKRLDLVNDPIEGNFTSIPNIGKYVFTSSWTAQSRDEIPMWMIYGNLEGVRFRMPIDLFNHTDKMSIIKSKTSPPSFEIKSELDKDYKFEVGNPVKFNSGRDYKSSSVFGPWMVEYSDNKDDILKDVLKKRIVHVKEIDYTLCDLILNRLGQKKSNFWSFEKEYRYRVFVHDARYECREEVLVDLFDDIITEYIDISYTKESLEGIEILLSPKATDSDEIKIKETLIEQGIKDFTIKKSTIKIN